MASGVTSKQVDFIRNLMDRARARGIDVDPILREAAPARGSGSPDLWKLSKGAATGLIERLLEEVK